MSWDSTATTLLLASLVRPLLIAVAAAAVLRLFRIRHPASQHAAWVVVLAGMLVVPVVSVFIPHYELAVLPARTSSQDALARGGGLQTVAPGFSGRPGGRGLGSPEIDPLLLHEQGLLPPPPSPSGRGQRGAADRVRAGMPSLLLGLYLAGFFLIAAYQAIGWFLLRRVVRRSSALSLRPLRVSGDVIVPAAVGVFRPAVILPRDWRRWPASTRRAVLAHEFAHIRRKDLFTSILAHFVRCVLWFNPLAWWVVRKVSQLAENACDAAALERVSDPGVYSRMLLEFAGRVNEAGYRVTLPGLAMIDSSGLGRRIDQIFALSSGTLRRFSRPGLVLALAGIPAMCLAAALTLTQAASAPRATERGLAEQPAQAPADPPLPVTQLAAAIPAPAVEPSPQADTALRSVLDQYCVRCHSAQRSGAGLRLDDIDVDISALTPAKDAQRWEKVLRTLRARSMPPANNERPDSGTNDNVVAWIEQRLDVKADTDWWPFRVSPITDPELALQLANFLWGSIPDDELWGLAARGTLKESKVLEQQVRRMLADPKSRAFVSNFFGKWLSLQYLPLHKPSPERFPDYDDDLRNAISKETELFLDSQVREDRGALELLSANYTFVNDRLARHYGIPNVSGGDFRRVTLPGDRRAGLLGQASLLMLTSQPDRLSPTTRGKWILSNLLGVTPPDPPASVPVLPPDDPGNPTSMRLRLEKHVSAAPCVACHNIIDPLGYAFENFNAIGQWQDSEGATPVDASGRLPDGTAFNGPAQFRAALLDRRAAFLHTAADRLLSYAIGRSAAQPGIRGVEYYELPSVRRILREASAANYSWSSLIAAVARSAPFQYRKAE